ncbi:hypothetical protein DIPPA_20385 [Diplonema papillatum]|nr:hypothetical protein DIPPA_20385 [Diplonema papillatum]
MRRDLRRGVKGMTDDSQSEVAQSEVLLLRAMLFEKDTEIVFAQERTARMSTELDWYAGWHQSCRSCFDVHELVRRSSSVPQQLSGTSSQSYQAPAPASSSLDDAAHQAPPQTVAEAKEVLGSIEGYIAAATAGWGGREGGVPLAEPPDVASTCRQASVEAPSPSRRGLSASFTPQASPAGGADVPTNDALVRLREKFASFSSDLAQTAMCFQRHPQAATSPAH